VTGEEGGSLVKGFFQRGVRRVDISDYHDGDVVEARTTRIRKGATVVGNVRAPEVHVEGAVVGAVVTMNVILSADGRIVGDVYTERLSMASGGQINGWVFAITQAEFDRLQSVTTDGEFEFPRAAEALGVDLLPPELQLTGQNGENEAERQARLEQVKALVGDALADRAALEKVFTRRVDEVAGETASRLADVEAALATAEADHEVEATARAALEAELAASRDENALQRRELDGVRDLLRQRVESLREKEEALGTLQARVEELDRTNLALQQKLSSALEPMERLQARVESLESALQASVLRSAEQEQAQLHWQELADASQLRVEKLEIQVALSAEQLSKCETVNDELRERLAWAEQRRAEAIREVDELRKAQASGTVGSPEAQRLDDALVRCERLDAQLDAARAEIAGLQEHLAWSRLSIKAATARLQAEESDHQQMQSALSRELENVMVEIAAQRHKEEDLQARIIRLTNLLYEADRRAKQRDEELEELRLGRDNREEHTLRQLLQRTTTEKEGLEKEVARQRMMILEQREQLAVVQAALGEVRQDLQKQMSDARAEITRLRSAASHHIQRLQAELAEREKQLHELKRA
jgi:chromosome segregation ATPase